MNPLSSGGFCVVEGTVFEFKNGDRFPKLQLSIVGPGTSLLARLISIELSKGKSFDIGPVFMEAFKIIEQRSSVATGKKATAEIKETLPLPEEEKQPPSSPKGSFLGIDWNTREEVSPGEQPDLEEFFHQHMESLQEEIVTEFENWYINNFMNRKMIRNIDSPPERKRTFNGLALTALDVICSAYEKFFKKRSLKDLIAFRKVESSW